ncbi:MAG: hypothetical protein LBS63_01085 [Prevotellaceae bacterium]|jgi:hypothetical protein|nr:hypothetical protein [Prevotellaceae bacterium]
MYTETTLRSQGMRILIKNLGNVEAERFITLVNREPFDYTEWQRGMFDGMSVRALSRMAMQGCCAEQEDEALETASM